MRFPSTFRTAAPAALLSLSALAACRSSGDYRREADEAVYRIVEARRAEVVAHPDAFTIDPPPNSLRARLLSGEQPTVEMLSFAQCLDIAAENSRQYRDQREGLYFAALDLTLERWRFGWLPAGTLSAKQSGVGNEPPTSTGTADFALAKIFGTGAKLISNLGISLTRDLSQGDAWKASSDLGLSITQPLLRGFGADIVLESLTQAERDVLYQARSYERFRRTFAVQVAERFYRILQQYDTLDNEQQNYEGLRLLRERNEALSVAGRLSDIQVDQARQDELRAKSRVIAAEQSVERQLDDLKLFLGLPIDARIGVDRGELERLPLPEQDTTAVDERRGVALALAERLDYLSIAQRVEDSERALRIAADDLRAGLGIAASANASSADDKPFQYNGNKTAWALSLELDLPLDRLPERNSYRAALIALEAAGRARDQLADQIDADLRQSLRSLAALREDYEIQRNSVELAQGRVESTRMNFDAGRAETRDLLEAQESLVGAKNLATRARIDYELERLALFRDLEALRVDERGLSIDPDLMARLRPEQP